MSLLVSNVVKKLAKDLILYNFDSIRDVILSYKNNFNVSIINKLQNHCHFLYKIMSHERFINNKLMNEYTYSYELLYIWALFSDKNIANSIRFEYLLSLNKSGQQLKTIRYYSYIIRLMKIYIKDARNEGVSLKGIKHFIKTKLLPTSKLMKSNILQYKIYISKYFNLSYLKRYSNRYYKKSNSKIINDYRLWVIHNFLSLNILNNINNKDISYSIDKLLFNDNVNKNSFKPLIHEFKFARIQLYCGLKHISYLSKMKNSEINIEQITSSFRILFSILNQLAFITLIYFFDDIYSRRKSISKMSKSHNFIKGLEKMKRRMLNGHLDYKDFSNNIIYDYIIRYNVNNYALDGLYWISDELSCPLKVISKIPKNKKIFQKGKSISQCIQMSNNYYVKLHNAINFINNYIDQLYYCKQIRNIMEHRCIHIVDKYDALAERNTYYNISYKDLKISALYLIKICRDSMILSNVAMQQYKYECDKLLLNE